MTNSLSLQFIWWYLIHFPSRILDNGHHLMIWCWRFFSIGFFVKTLVAPWHKDISSYGVGFNFAVWLHTFSWNLISRVIGAILRLFFITIGLIFEVTIIFAAVWVLALWLALPAMFVYLLLSAIR